MDSKTYSKEEIDRAIIDAAELVTKSGSMPESIWHPHFGWVLFQGELTETSIDFYEYLKGIKK